MVGGSGWNGGREGNGIWMGFFSLSLFLFCFLYFFIKILIKVNFFFRKNNRNTKIPLILSNLTKNLDGRAKVNLANSLRAKMEYFIV